MPKYGGFLLAFEPKRTTTVARRLRASGEAAESFSSVDWDFMPREVALLVLNPSTSSIGAAVLMERMHGSGGTGKLKMRLVDPVTFEEPISEDLVRDIVLLSEGASTADRLKRMSGPTWSALVARIKKLRPEKADALEHLLARREEDHRLFGDSNAARRLMEQRDALGLALEIGELDRKKVLRSINPRWQKQAQSVLDVLDAEEMHEQDIMRHDERVFRDLLDPAMRHAQFEGSEGRTVRLHVYDKKPLETVAGIDLLIYQDLYESFLLIQYKAMDPVRRKDGLSWSYTVDPQTHKQIDAMGEVEAEIRARPVDGTGIWDWRLYASPFYFKYAETTRLNARDDSLIQGIILDVDHLKRFLRLPQSEGERGARKIGYDNCPRYLNNTQFVELARSGWIGCDRSGYSLIAKLLKENQRGGKMAMLAALNRPKEADARGRKR